MKTTRYLDTHPGNRPRIFAHRGLTYQNNRQVADENTLYAFELALKAGADYLESDIQVTSDGVPVLFHDADLKRLLGKSTSISNMSLNELIAIRLPLGGSIPTLAEALESFPDAKFNLDLKTVRAETVGIETIQELNAEHRVLISSFNEASRKRALSKTQFPFATSAGSQKVLASYISARLGVSKVLARILRDIDALQLPQKLYGLDFTHPRFIEQVLQTETEIHYWTINEPALMQELFALGAHGIVTDRTDLARRAFN